ncbi:methyltransferase domain-containing protein [Simkania sp.]|uniref:methyltransferase domain-containing protein n=1 Tax=Simkania sp. TaxID=34094 RepID=UPI003B528EC0
MMTIRFFMLFATLSFLSCAYSETQQELETRLFLQQKYKVAGWCLAPYNGKYVNAEILEMNEDSFEVRIIDTSVSIRKWPTISVPIQFIKSLKHQTHTSLESLTKFLKEFGILKTPKIEHAYQSIDRQWFCSQNSYDDAAIDIGCNMVISSPHMHIFYLEFLKNRLPHAKSILDLGSGSGHLTALLAHLAPNANVIGVDYFDELVKKSKNTCHKYLPRKVTDRIKFLSLDGIKGYKNAAPYDIICVGFMYDEIPFSLIDQLNDGGILLVPIKTRECPYSKKFEGGRLFVIQKNKNGLVKINEGFSCSFVSAIQDQGKKK